MRILFAITQGDIGGAQEHARILASQLVDRGHTVRLVTQPGSAMSERFREFGVESFVWKSIRREPNPIADLRARRELKEVLAEFHPDVLHLSTAKAGVVGRGLLRKSKSITVYTCHHPSFGKNRQLSHRLIGRPLEQLTLPLVDGIISDGSRDAAMLQDLAPKVPLRIIRNTVPAATGFTIGARDEPVAIWVARFASPKDPLLLVNAWKHVVAELPTARLIMCGTGPLLDATREHVNQLGLNNSIDVAGFVQDIEPLYREASLFILTTKVEGGVTMATLDAMTHELVPVVSDAGDLPVIGTLGCGFVVGTKPEGVARVIVDAFTDRDRLRTAARAAKTFVDSYTPSDHADEVEDFYQFLLERRLTNRNR
jgi:glycosyltransferase involved in cell wall biosynthesis